MPAVHRSTAPQAPSRAFRISRLQGASLAGLSALGLTLWAGPWAASVLLPGWSVREPAAALDGTAVSAARAVPAGPMVWMDAQLEPPAARFIAAPAGQVFVPAAAGQPLIARPAQAGGGLVLALGTAPRDGDALHASPATPAPPAVTEWPVTAPGAVMAARLADADAALQWRPDGTLRDAQDQPVPSASVGVPRFSGVVFQPMPSRWTVVLSAEPPQPLAVGAAVALRWPSGAAGVAVAADAGEAPPAAVLTGHLRAVQGRELTVDFAAADVQRHMHARLMEHAATGVPLWPSPLGLALVGSAAPRRP